MMRFAAFVALAMTGACAAATPAGAPSPEVAATLTADVAADGPPAASEAVATPVALGADAAEPKPAAPYTINGAFTQGGLVFGATAPGAAVRLDGAQVMVGADGRFVFGFGRDNGPSATLELTTPDGRRFSETFEIAAREFKIDRIDGIDQSKVSGFTPAQLAKIEIDREKKRAARTDSLRSAEWATGFIWPATGRISGVFGSQRVLNGEPQNPHSGLDIAAPTGTPVRAPAPGIVRLAEPDMYFEGGLIFLDHGHWLESSFLHLSRIDVTPGQRVAQGDIIGAIGSTGRSTGPHLHWTLRWKTRTVDPRLVLGEMPSAGGAAAR